MSSLSCNLKGRQQVFYFKENRAASCCRAHPIDLPDKLESAHDLWNHESLQLKNGIKLSGCSHCWQEEENGKSSYRTLSNPTARLRIEINFGNLCNHMCSYCGPRFSSMWQNSISNLGNFQNIFKSDIQHLTKPEWSTKDPSEILLQLKRYLQNINEPVNVVLLGGEPLMQIDSLEKLFDFELSDFIFLEIITNLNPPSTRFLEQVLSRYADRPKQIQFLISLDATPEFNHVIRHGFDTTRFHHCLDLINQIDCNKTILSTISALSVLDLPNYLDWIKRNSFQVRFNNLQNPRSLKVSNVPFDIRQDIMSSVDIDYPIVKEQLRLPESNGIDRYSCYQYLSQYFARTNLDLSSVHNNYFRQFWKAISS